MIKRHVKIGELNFDIITPVDEESLPTLEIENDSSAVFIKVELEKAIELRDLLNAFIQDVL